MTTGELFDELIQALAAAAREIYGSRLVSFVVFGSVGRGKARPDSDLDVLIVADPLPRGRFARASEFAKAEEAIEPMLDRLRQDGLTT